MEFYKIGTVVSIGKHYIIFETNNIGEIIYIVNPNNYEANTQIKLYIYVYKNDFQTMKYGFKNFKSRLLFEDLISLPGIGPKSAINLLKYGPNQVMNWIASDNIDKLKELKSIGDKLAKQIVLEFGSKYSAYLKKYEPQNELQETKNDQKNILKEASETLKLLGFEKEQINYGLNQINDFSDIEKIVEEVISIIAKQNNQAAN
ncbi:MAG: Holliday junction branch migration protein RuvA [Mycoplasma sp.]|nr:Holliday junction branch migration protein RuvA [Mycoplasma sp.]